MSLHSEPFRETRCQNRLARRRTSPANANRPPCLLLSFLAHTLAVYPFDLLQVPPDILNPDEPEHRRWAASPLVKVIRSVQHLQHGPGEPRGCFEAVSQ